MDFEAFTRRLKGTACVKCGNHSKAKGKEIMLLDGSRYREAIGEFGKDGRLPTNTEWPRAKTRNPKTKAGE